MRKKTGRTMINHTRFFDAYRTRFDPLQQLQVDGLDFLLRSFNREPRWADVRNVSYALATIKRETGVRVSGIDQTYQPIEEKGSKVYLSKYYLRPSLRTALGNIKLSDAWDYKGRGYVQITGRHNYTVFQDLIVQPLVMAPGLALLTDNAFRIMTIGMFEGRFTGRRLGHYITPTGTDYINARRVINGLDHATEIAANAVKFEAILREATT